MNEETMSESTFTNRDAVLAPRLTRLGAMLIDGFITLPFSVVIALYSGWLQLVLKGQPLSLRQSVLVAFFGWVVFIATNSHPLIRHGQTIGKYLCKLRMVTLEDQMPPFWRLAIFRYGSIQLMGFLGVFGLIDPLLIFRRNRRCLHDILGGTKVVTATMAPVVIAERTPNNASSGR